MRTASTFPPAPVDADGLARALQPFGSSTMLPAEAYVSEQVLAWERRHIFAATWTCVGRLADLAVDTTGSDVTQRAVTVGDVPVLLTIRDGGAVTALANTCRHRGHELLADDATSTRHSIVCPYHAWTYRLGGELAQAPRMQAVDGFDAREHSLVALPVEVWHGWVFVNATGHSPAFDDHVGALTELVAPYAPQTLVLRARHAYEVAANWKVICENYHECYHCPLIHPELCQVSPPTSGSNYDLPGAWVGGTMALRDGMQTMSLDGRSHAPRLPGADHAHVLYVGLLPNLLVSAHPDYVMTHRLVPLTPGRTWVECSWYFASESADPTSAVDFWDLTNKQDWAACESVQRGLGSPHFRPGPLGPDEGAVHQWVTMIGRLYRGLPAEPERPLPPVRA
jgi:Rieske 2Fe-2S family protein